MEASSKTVTAAITVLNEAGNIDPIISSFSSIKRTGEAWTLTEIVFIDGGSRDGTIENIQKSVNRIPGVTIRIVNQTVKPGTCPATVEASSKIGTDWIIVMDGDLQHPVETIPEMLNKKASGYDLLVASRYVEGGNYRRSISRGAISKVAEIIARFMVPGTRTLKDPLSGFFVCDTELIRKLKPLPGTYKILLYVIASYRNLRLTEIPYYFLERKYGKSKVTDRSTHFMRRYLKEVRLYRKIGSSRKKY